MKSSTTSTKKYITLKEVQQNNGGLGRKHYIVVAKKVFDVTGFSHPGGNEVFENNTYDKYEDFKCVGHSSRATQLLKSFYIGHLK